jgi:peptidyl-prolyl cis-trans isomerase C
MDPGERGGIAVRFGILLVLGCGRPPADPSARTEPVDLRSAIARVDDQVITVGDIERQINRQPPFVRARYATMERKKELLHELVRLELMAKEAQRRGYDRDPEIVESLKRQMVNALVSRDFDAKPKTGDVSSADIERYYLEHRAEFVQGDEVRVSQIVVKDRLQAIRLTAAAKAIRDGGPALFQSLVTKHSQDEESRQRMGDLGFFGRASGRYPKPLVDAALSLQQLNEVAGPVETPKGFHILRLTGRRSGFTRPLSEVSRLIESRLHRENREKRIADWTEGLRKQARVELFEGRLEDVKVAPPPPGFGSEPLGRASFRREPP